MRGFNPADPTFVVQSSPVIVDIDAARAISCEGLTKPLLES